MFNNHTMTMVTDLNMVMNDIRNVDYFIVAAVTTSPLPELKNIYEASILIPPTEILMEWVDGNSMVMNVEYPKYLMSKECDDMIVALIAALTQKNIILYIPAEEFGVFGQLLLNHIYYTYGITCNTPTTTFSIVPAKIPFIASKFFMMDVMDAKDYLNMYPGKYRLPDFVINKLAEELHPFNHPASFEEYANYFNKYTYDRMMQEMNGNNIEPKVMIEYVNKK